MSLRERVQDWLGLTESYQRQISIVLRLQKIHDMQEDLMLLLAEPINKLATALLDEHSAARKAASDMLGEEAIKRARGEDAARKHTLGEL